MTLPVQDAVPAEQWMALRELHEGRPPTLGRLADASQIPATTLKNRKHRGGWGHFSRAGAKAEDEGGEGFGGGQADEMMLAAGGAEGTAEERMARVSDLLLREVEAIGLIAQAKGKLPDKARIEAVGAMIRLLEKVEEFAVAKAGGTARTRDGEVAAVLARIDARIEELARAYAREIVAAREADAAVRDGASGGNAGGSGAG